MNDAGYGRHGVKDESSGFAVTTQRVAQGAGPHVDPGTDPDGMSGSKVPQRPTANSYQSVTKTSGYSLSL
jgi:hypothetical protein